MNKPILKKICIITTVHQAFDIRIFHKQAKTLSKAGYQVSLIVTHDKEETIDNIKIVPLKQSQNRFERIFLKTFKAFIIACKENADIYHFHDPELYLTEAAIKIIKRKPVIHDAHEHYDKDILGKIWIAIKYRKLYLFFFKLLEQLCLPFIDAVVFVVPAIGERYKKFNGLKFEIRNYPDQTLFSATNDSKERNFTKAIFIGGVTPVRGITELIEAYRIITKTIPEAKLDIIGKASPSYQKELTSLIEDYNLQENITLYDHIPVTELSTKVSKASIGLVTYLPITENNIIGLPNKIFEYMSCKLAVICSNFPLYEEVINNSKCGYTVDPSSPEDIAEKLIYLFDNPDTIKEMGISGYDKVMESYNWENESKKLLDLYDQLLKGP